MGNGRYLAIRRSLSTQPIAAAGACVLGKVGCAVAPGLYRRPHDRTRAGHGHGHGEVHFDEADWAALADHSELEGEVFLRFVTGSAGWVTELRGGASPPVQRVLDIGSGPGVGTCEFARCFPDAQVTAIDGSGRSHRRVTRDRGGTTAAWELTRPGGPVLASTRFWSAAPGSVSQLRHVAGGHRPQGAARSLFMIRVLGPVQIVAADGRTVDLPSASQRRLLALLALHSPRPVRAVRLAAVLDVSPSGLRTGITRLRRGLGDGSLMSTAGYYRLVSAVDAHQFCRAIAATSTSPHARVATLESALAMWTGPPFDEFADEAWAAGEATRLIEMHAAAVEDLAEQLVSLDRCADAIALLAPHIGRHPLRDRPRGLLLRGLAGDGRQAEALRAYHDYRTMLADKTGTEPSAVVRAIGQRVAAGWNGRDA